MIAGTSRGSLEWLAMGLSPIDIRAPLLSLGTVFSIFKELRERGRRTCSKTILMPCSKALGRTASHHNQTFRTCAVFT